MVYNNFMANGPSDSIGTTTRQNVTCTYLIFNHKVWVFLLVRCKNDIEALNWK